MEVRLINIAILTAPLLIGYLLDLILGDPAWMPHPARAVGWFARSLESVVRWAFPRTQTGQSAAGVLLAVLVPVVSLLIPAVLLAFAYSIHIALWFAFDTMLCYQLISTRGLHDAGMRVYSALDKDEHGDLSRARLALSRMTERDTGSMNRQQIIKATVGVLADGTTGGVVAPLLFMAVGGGALGVFYRAVSVTASVSGRDNTGFGAAPHALIRLCDFIPSRIAAGLLLLSAWVSGLDVKAAISVSRRDAWSDDKPPPEQSICAGALGITLGGRASHKSLSDGLPVAGDNLRPAQPDDIRLTCRLMLFSSLFCILLLCAVKFAVLWLMFL